MKTSSFIVLLISSVFFNKEARSLILRRPRSIAAATLSLSPSPDGTGREGKRSGRDRPRTSENQARRRVVPEGSCGKQIDRMIKQLLNSVFAKYRDLSVSRRSIICLSLRLRQIIDLLATDKSRYFAKTEFNNC